MSRPRDRMGRRRWAGVAASAVGAVVALTALAPPASADPSATWGPQGATSTDSAVTVAWDNTGNPDGDRVARDAGQVLPHTGGKTYADVWAPLSSAARAAYGGLKVNVSQTRDLVHQVVNLQVTGVAGTIAAGQTNTDLYLDAFQCWGAAGESAPDPTHCQTGVGGFDQPSGTLRGWWRQLSRADRTLTAGGDLKASTWLTLTGSLAGTSKTDSTTTLTASLTANVWSGGNPAQVAATGARGTVEFDLADGTVLARGVPVAQGTATATLTGVMDPADDATVVATYTAAPDETYLSDTSAPLTLPVRLPADTTTPTAVPAGATTVLSFAAGTYTANQTVLASLDNATSTTLGTADAFGALAVRYPVPGDLAAGSTHTLRVISSDYKVQHTFSYQIATPPTPPTGGAGTNAAPANATSDVPLQTVAGAWVGRTLSQALSATTANELVNVQPAASAKETAARGFELQTGAESAALGCGYRADAASTNTCWLVLVPRGFTGDPGLTQSSLTPSLWAQRVQVRLGFADVAPSCPGGQLRTLALGGEVLAAAMASWTPAVCAADKVALGFSQLAEAQARAQYTAGSANLILTSRPVDDSGGTSTRYAPVALAGTVIAVRLFPYLGESQPNPPPLTDVRLNARLVAKLLTQSYQTAASVGGNQLSEKAPWVYQEIGSLISDPEFLALNPRYAGSVARYLGDKADLLVSINRSDPVDALWSWLVADHDSRAFLDGCPDEASGKSVVNPFYSTRTYAECPDQATALEATAAATIDTTVKPSTFTYTKPVYPPADGGFPQPGWYQLDANTTLDQLALTMPDLHPQQTSLDIVGLDVYKGLEPHNDAWCTVLTCSTPVPAGQPGKWVNSATPGYFNRTMGVTTSVTSARYQNVTASLCDDDGHCVGATSDSLQKAAAAFTSATGTPVQPTGAADIAAGAYPLTVPVYAEVNTAGLSKTDAATIAAALGTITGTGQTPGAGSGQLPPGYAPAVPAQAAMSAATIAALKSIAAGKTPTTTPTPTPTVTTVSSTPAAGTTGAPSAGPVLAATPAAAPTSGGVVTAGSGQGAATAATRVGFPRLGVLGTVAGGLAAAVGAPLLGRSRKKTKR